MSLIEQALRRMRGSEAPPSPSAAPPRDSRRSRWAFARFVEESPGEPATEAESDRRPRLHVDLAALRAAGLLPPEPQERTVARQFRHIKLPLVQRIAEDVAGAAVNRLIMVASALSGEGKTFCTVNLAFSMARERDTEVVMIDADVAKPNISKAFGVGDQRGLVDALTDESIDINQLVQPTDVDGLSILPAGRFDEDTATELLSSSRMREVVAQMSAARLGRILVFDTPPLLLTTESRVLAELMGQVVLVVRAHVTPRQAVYDALGALREDQSVGLILNQSTAKASDAYTDYYGYGGTGTHGYGNYGREEPTRQDAREQGLDAGSARTARVTRLAGRPED